MKPALIFNQYIWIINTFKTYGKLTLEQLDQKWREAKVAEGNPLPRTSFNRHRDAILDMFGVIIDCEPKTHKYYISNPGMLTIDVPMAHVVVHAYDRTPHYLRTLPLHHSQCELQSGDNYTDFSPTRQVGTWRVCRMKR